MSDSGIVALLIILLLLVMTGLASAQQSAGTWLTVVCDTERADQYCFVPAVGPFDTFGQCVDYNWQALQDDRFVIRCVEVIPVGQGS